MATTTPNYGWAVPTSTDLVKDGATAIETLGDAIDASMNTALGTKKAGMVLLNTTSFSAVSSQSVNSVFSSTYKNYRLVYNGTKTVDTPMLFRFRASGTDDSSANYYWGANRSFASTATYELDKAAASTSGAFVSTNGANAFQNADITIYSPFESVVTKFSGTNVFSSASSAAAIGGGWSFGAHLVASAFDGLTILAGSGTITGTVSIYGVNA
jgi:hypothetical protein